LITFKSSFSLHSLDAGYPSWTAVLFDFSSTSRMKTFFFPNDYYLSAGSRRLPFFFPNARLWICFPPASQNGRRSLFPSSLATIEESESHFPIVHHSRVLPPFKPGCSHVPFFWVSNPFPFATPQASQLTFFPEFEFSEAPLFCLISSIRLANSTQSLEIPLFSKPCQEALPLGGVLPVSAFSFTLFSGFLFFFRRKRWFSFSSIYQWSGKLL